MPALQEKERIAKMMFVLRTISGKTQTKISKALKVSFQQIQKYEKALNGIGSDKLFILAKEEGWDINLLYNGNPEQILPSLPIFKQDMVARKFREIEANIREERKLQARYAPLMPKLNRELAYENTFKDPVADKDPPEIKEVLDEMKQEHPDMKFKVTELDDNWQPIKKTN